MQTFLLFAIIQSHLKFQEELFVHASMTHSSS